MLWRPVDSRLGVEVALVHRPGRLSWTLPKGKLRRGEHAVMGALREVQEETGHQASLGPQLGLTTYRKDGGRKRVRYWSMQATAGDFVANREIDDLVWVPPDAAARLARDIDRPVIERFWRERAHVSRPLVLVRPGSSGSGRSPAGTGDRSLDRRGRRQARALAEMIEVFGVRRALTVEVRSWTETLAPFRQNTSVAVEPLPVGGRGRKVRTAVEEILRSIREGVPTVVCAERELLGRVSRELAEERRDLRRRVATLPHGSMYVLHVDRHSAGRVLTAEHIRPRV